MPREYLLEDSGIPVLLLGLWLGHTTPYFVNWKATRAVSLTSGLQSNRIAMMCRGVALASTTTSLELLALAIRAIRSLLGSVAVRQAITTRKPMALFGLLVKRDDDPVFHARLAAVSHDF